MSSNFLQFKLDNLHALVVYEYEALVTFREPCQADLDHFVIAFKLDPITDFKTSSAFNPARQCFVLDASVVDTGKCCVRAFPYSLGTSTKSGAAPFGCGSRSWRIEGNSLVSWALPVGASLIPVSIMMSKS